MENCKTIEAKIDFLKTLFEKITLILLALGGGLGTLLVKPQKLHGVIVLNLFFLITNFGLWLVIILLWKKEIDKLNSCKEEEK